VKETEQDKLLAEIHAAVRKADEERANSRDGMTDVERELSASLGTNIHNRRFGSSEYFWKRKS
jgi:hypothetical protein